MVQNPILRDTYLHDCSQRIGINEATLINQMNNMIRDRKESGVVRDSNMPQQEAATSQTGYATTPQTVVGVTQTSNVSTPIEQLLIQLVIKYGDRVIFNDVEDENGNVFDLSVAEYISVSLSADELSFHDQTYNDILNEAVEHCENREFKTESYFVHHHDIKISQLAINMTEERFKLSESQQTKDDDESLRNRIQHLLLDFRMEYVEQHLKDLKKQIAQSSSDSETLFQLMADFKDMTEMRNALARQLGNNIIV